MGKSLFGDMLGKKMGKGRDHWLSAAYMHPHTFNGYLVNKRLIVLEDYKEHIGYAKKLIRCDPILIQRPLAENKLIENRLNILLLSDNPIESDDIINVPALEAIAILHYLTT